jgi:MFS transporter, DHA2 family, multidrug resistance protein
MRVITTEARMKPNGNKFSAMLESGGDPRRWYVLGTVMLGLFMAVLDSNIVNVALPHMMASLGTDADHIRWVIEAYAMSYAIFTLTTSWLRERIGIKKCFVAGLAIFTAASILCGISWSVESMIACRVLQGIGGGIMMPTGFTLITESFPASQRGAAFGVFGIVIVVAPSLGPTLGGYLVDFVNWRYIFYINVPVGILTVFLALAFLREYRELKPRPFDFLGFAGLATFLGCLLVALTDGQREGWRSDFILSYFAVSAIGFLAFIISAPRSKYPVLDIRLFANFHFSVLSILNIMRASALFGRMYLLPLFLQTMVGYSARAAGFLLLPGALVSGLVMPVTGSLVDRYGPKYFIFSGLALMGYSTFMYHSIDVVTPYSAILIPMIIFGVGAGFLNTPLSATAMNVVKPEQVGQVSTVLSVLMQVGGAFGVAMLGTITADRTAFHRAVFAEKIAPYSYETQSVLQALHSLGGRIGESDFLSSLQSPAVLDLYVRKQAAIAGFQDAFVYTALICAIALVPALGIFSYRHHRRVAMLSE